MRRGTRRITAAVAAMAAMLPLAARAGAPVNGTATAGTAALTLTVDPTALLSIPSADLDALPSTWRDTLRTALQPVTVQVDGANASASRTAADLDLVAGHSDATPIALNLTSLSQLLAELRTVLSGVAGTVTVPSLSSTLAAVQAVTSNATVMALLPGGVASGLQTLSTQLTALSTALTAMSSDATAAVDALQTALTQQLSALLQYTTGLQADIDTAHPDGQVQSSAALTVPPPITLPSLVPAMPVIAQLAPFGATAVTAGGATLFGASGPQASSSEATTSLDVSPAMDLTSLRSDMAAVTTLLTQALSTASSLQAQLPAVSALTGGLDLSTLIANLTAAQTPASQLDTLVEDLQLEKMLSCDTLGTGSCVIASTAITPTGSGLHAIATSKLVDLSVLPMDATLASAFGAFGAHAGTPLLEVQGVQASSDAIIDGTTSTAQASGDVTYISVAGLVVMDHGAINTAALQPYVPQSELDKVTGVLPIGEPMVLEINTGAGVLTLQITLGTEQRTYTATQHQSASLGKMQVLLLNGDAHGANPATAFGASRPGTIVNLNTASVSSEVLGSSTAAGSSPTPAPSGGATPTPSDGAGQTSLRNASGTDTLVPESTGSNVDMGKTGMAGSWWFAVGAALVALGAWLRRRSRPLEKTLAHNERRAWMCWCSPATTWSGCSTSSPWSTRWRTGSFSSARGPRRCRRASPRPHPRDSSLPCRDSCPMPDWR